MASAPPPTRDGARRVHPVVWTGLVLVLLQLVLRTLAATRGWFYVDDFLFLSQAEGRPLTPGYLLAPHDSQFMPGGVLLTWLASRAGSFAWSAVVVQLVLVQALASLACLWMLVRLFGRRWWVLVPLAFYLFSPMTLSGFMWWSVALNQLPCQLACFLLLVGHVEHLRTGRTRWAVLAVAALVLGLAFYVKTLLLLGPLVLLSVLYLAPPAATRRRRLRRLLVEHRVLWAAYAVVAAVYTWHYVTAVPDPVATSGRTPYLSLLGTMLGTSLPTLALGGPWRWSDVIAPIGLVDTPGWGVGLAWVVIVVLVVAVARRRGADVRPLVVVAPYLLASAVLVAQARGRAVGGLVGLAPRYLADAAPLLALAVALLWARSLRSPAPPADGVPARRTLAAVGAVSAVLLLGTLVSSVSYVRLWDGPWAGKDFTQRVAAQVRQGPLEVADTTVPAAVLPSWTYPGNLTSRFFEPLGDRVAARTRGNDLAVLDRRGVAHQATVSPLLKTAPGPLAGCGYLVQAGTDQRVPLTGPGADYFWWAQISYLSGSRTTVAVQVGSVHRTIELERGLHNYVVQGYGAATEVRLAPASPDTHVCVDHVRVGDLVPAGTRGTAG